MSKHSLPPVSVYKHENTWRWVCRVPSCSQSEWRGRHVDALRDAQRHLASHAWFGFGRG